MARKTIPVHDVVEAGNRMLAVVLPNEGLTDYARRNGVIGMIEFVLHETGNYRGFSYLPSELAEPGVLREDYDNTRRVYS